MSADHLAHFRRVDIDVDDTRSGAEFFRLADNTVVETRADVDQQVALDHRLVRVGGTVHAKHPERKWVIFRENTLAEKRRSDRAIEGLRQVHEFLVCAGDHATLAGEDNRALGLGYHFGSFLDGCRANFE